MREYVGSCGCIDLQVAYENRPTGRVTHRSQPPSLFLLILSVIVIARRICLFCLASCVFASLSPCLLLPLTKITAIEAVPFLLMKLQAPNFSFNPHLSLFFHSVGPFSSLKEMTDTFVLALSLSVPFLFQLHACPFILLSLCLSFFHSPPPSLSLSPSAPLLFQWASNWGSVIGREKRLGENESL